MPHVLVLNASYEPLGVVPLRRALVLVLENKAICL
ncbi:HNH endonuclease [Streptomyces badius]